MGIFHSYVTVLPEGNYGEHQIHFARQVHSLTWASCQRRAWILTPAHLDGKIRGRRGRDTEGQEGQLARSHGPFRSFSGWFECLWKIMVISDFLKWPEGTTWHNNAQGLMDAYGRYRTSSCFVFQPTNINWRASLVFWPGESCASQHPMMNCAYRQLGITIDVLFPLVGWFNRGVWTNPFNNRFFMVFLWW